MGVKTGRTDGPGRRPQSIWAATRSTGMTADYADGGWRPRFVCPACSASLDGTATGLWCPSCSADYDCRVGIYRLLSAERLAQLEPFLAQYRHVRRRDGYRTDDPDYYQRLPNVDHNHSQADIWRVRRDTYRRLRSRVLARFADRSLTVLDLGSGSGWLSHRLAELGHRAVALDCLDDDVTDSGSGGVTRAGSSVCKAISTGCRLPPVNSTSWCSTARCTTPPMWWPQSPPPVGWSRRAVRSW